MHVSYQLLNLNAEGLEANVEVMISSSTVEELEAMGNGGAVGFSGEAWLDVPLRSGSASQHGSSACISSNIFLHFLPSSSLSFLFLDLLQRGLICVNYNMRSVVVLAIRRLLLGHRAKSKGFGGIARHARYTLIGLVC